MKLAEYKNAALFLFTAAVFIACVNYLAELDKVRILYGAFMPLRAILFITIFYFTLQRFLLPRHLAVKLEPVDWFLRCVFWLFIMFAATIAIVLSALPLFLSLPILFVVESFGVQIPSEMAIRLQFSLYGVPAGLIGGLCLWGLLKKTFRMTPDVSVIWRRYMVWTSLVCSVGYFTAAITFEGSCPRTHCNFEKEFSAVIFLTISVAFFAACLHVYHRTKDRIIATLDD